MSKRNWVCFDCRSAVRREADIAKAVVCATCSKPLVNLGYQIPIPAKRDIRNWEALCEQYLVEQRARRAKAAQDRQRQRRGLEQEIERIESRPRNAGRSKAVRQLRKKLGNITR